MAMPVAVAHRGVCLSAADIAGGGLPGRLHRAAAALAGAAAS
jgi:hypothetical protein